MYCWTTAILQCTTNTSATTTATATISVTTTIRRETAREELKSSRDKNARHEPLVGRGEKSLLCDPGSKLRLGGREREGEDHEWKKKNCVCRIQYDGMASHCPFALYDISLS